MKSDIRLSPAERETVITYNEETKRWHAWTCIPTHYRKFQASGWALEKEVIRDDVLEQATFSAPAKGIAIRDPKPRSRNLSDEQRAAISERLINYNKTKAQN